MFVYHIFMTSPLWLAVGPKSVRNRLVIEVFGGVFMLSRCLMDFSVGVGAEPDLFLFLLLF